MHGMVSGMLPYVQNWFATAIEQESGYKELIANIVSFFLSVASVDASFPEEYLQTSLRYFPPADLAETETQIELIVSIFKRSYSLETTAQAAIALSKFFVEAPAKSVKRNVPENVVSQGKALFKTLCMQSQDILDAVMGKYANQRQKKAILQRILQ